VRTIELSYSLTNAEGCTADSIQTITINPLPKAADIAFDIKDNKTIVCYGETIELEASYLALVPQRTITWSLSYSDGSNSGVLSDIAPVSSIGSIPVTAPTTYTVTSFTDGNGCTNNNLPTLTASVALKAPVEITEAPIGGGICLPDGTLDLTVKVSSDASDNLTYIWTNAAGDTVGTDADYTATAAGVYQVKVEGCNADSATATITEQLPIIVQKRNHTLVANNNASTNGGYEFQYYKWYKGGELLWENLGGKDKGGYYYTGGSNLSTDIDYWVIVKDVNGVEYRSCPFRPVLKAVPTIVQAYPNPTGQAANTQVYVDVEIDDEAQLSGASIAIYSPTGAYLGSVPVTGRITVVSLPSITGVYVLSFKSAAISKEIKIIVE
jgi:hypothetical protein